MSRHSPIVADLCLTLLSVLTLALTTPACTGPAPERPTSILLVTIDTLRADHLGPYVDLLPAGHSAPATPRIDALAANGVVFENAAAPMPLTLPSHFSIFTSSYPREHGVMNNAMSLPPGVTSLPEIFLESGYSTGGFVSVSILDEAAGAGRGFETFFNPDKPRQRSARMAVTEAIDWLGTLPVDSPFFAWVHLFDPHQPYGSPEAPRDGLDPELAERWPMLHWTQLRDIARDHDGDIPTEVLEHALALYRAEVEYVDYQVGALLEGLVQHGRRDDTLVAITADHGEAFENGVYFEHADSLFDSAIRVPLVFSHPGATGSWPVPGTRVQEQVSSIDIAPTLLTAAGLAVPRGFSGRPLQHASRFGDRYVLIQHPFIQQTRAETHPHVNSVVRSVGGRPVSRINVDKERVGIVGTDWKLIRTDDVSVLYRRSVDPDERNDVAAAEPATRANLEAILESTLAEHPLNLIEPGHINAELRQTLEALGYFD